MLEFAEYRDSYEDCWACEGTGLIECDCIRCRSDEGRACGVWGHVPTDCTVCGGTGEVPVLEDDAA